MAIHEKRNATAPAWRVALCIAVLSAGGNAATVVGRIPGEFATTAMGAAAYVMPIDVSPGLGGLSPAVALSYNSQTGDGHAGLGWTLTGFPKITRCPLTMAVDGRVQGVRFGVQDRFCLDGQPLVLLSGVYGGDGAEYRLEIHGNERIISRGRQGVGPLWFELRQSDGLVKRFGNDADSRVEAAGNGEVMAWALNEVEDRFQQRVSYTYTEDSAKGEHYPAEVRWTHSASEHPDQASLRLGFSWETRPAEDIRTGFLWGSSWRNSVRLSGIDYEADEGTGLRLVHHYALAYAPPDAGGTQRSRLASVTQCGPADCLPPTEFVWDPRSGERQLVSSDGPASDAIVPGDFNGDGATDLYAGSNGAWSVWASDPDSGGFKPPVSVGHVASSITVGVPLDFNGDGQTDLLAGFGDGFTGVVFVAPATPGGAFAAVGVGPVSPAAMEVQPLDIDGDALDDLVYLRNGMAYLRRNLGGSLSAEQGTGIRAVSAPFTPFQDGFGFIEPADFDGDGRQDLLVARSLDPASGSYRWEAFLSTGSGYAADPIASFMAPAGPGKVLVADLNGDGLSDILRFTEGAWQPFISHGSSSGGVPGLVPASCPSELAQEAATVLDYDGDGRSDLLAPYSGWWAVYTPSSDCFSAQRFTELRQPLRSDVSGSAIAADTNGDGNTDIIFPSKLYGDARISLYKPAQRNSSPELAYRPDLLHQVTDGLGNYHAISYRPLTGWSGYTTAGTAPAGTRALRGGPLTVISQYAANKGSGVASYLVSYTYSGALLDTRGRGFLGFATIRSADSRNGLATETSYRQEFPYTNHASRVTVRSGAKLVSTYDAQWADTAVPVTDAAQDIHFVHLVGDTRDSYEVDTDGGYSGNLVRRTARTLGWNTTHGAVTSEQTTVTAPQQPATSYRTTRTVTLDDPLRTSSGCLGFPSRADVTREVSGGSPESRTVQYSWDLRTCQLVTQTDGPPGNPARQLNTTYSYDAAGRMIMVAVQDGAGELKPRRTRYGYDAGAWQPTTESALVDGEPDLTVTHSWSRAFGRVTSRINPQGLANSWLYDEFGRVRTETRSPGNTQFSYSACGPCFVASARYAVRETRSDGFWTETHHDSFGRVVGRSFVLADGRISRQVIEYDAAGRVGREALPYLDGSDNVYWTTYAYDALGRPRSIDRPVSETEPSGATQSFTYAGLDMTARDAELRTSVFTSDAEGRLISVRSAKNTTTAYAYTPFGQLSAIVDSALHRREMRYEERGLLAEVTDPDAGQRTFTYNAFGELVGQADGMTPPSATDWEYDQLGRVTRRAEAEGVTVWSYSATPGPGRGLLVQVAAPGENGPTSFQESYAYDSKSRLQRVITSIDGSAYQMDYGYGPENKIRTVTYPSTVGWRPRFIFGYSNGHLSLIAQDNAGIAPLYTLLEMDASGRDTHASLGYDYFREVARYDQANGRLTAIHSGTVSSPALFQNYAYAWDRVGNLLQRQDAGVSPARTETFTYDSLDRLNQVALDGVTTLTMSYTADGNLRMKSDVGGMAYGMDGAGPHALTAVGGGPAGIMGFAYDANGNMTSRNGSAITWTSFNQPRQVNSGADFARFRYGPGRNRIRQDLKIGGTTKTVHYVNPYFEVEIQGGTRRFRSNVFAYGRAIYSQVESTAGGPENYYVLHDHLGSVDRLLRSAGSGSDAVAFSFDAWGKRRNTNWTVDPAGARYADAHWTRRGYTGHEHLDNTRLVNMNGRLQDPFLGRMLSPDPVVGSLSSPQTLNPYSYVSNRPLSYFDPSGYFLSKLRKGLKRAIRHLGSTGRRVVRRWGRQIAAAVAAYYTAGAVSSWAYSAQAGGLAAGGVAAEGMASSTLSAAYASSSVLGGLAGGAVAGAIGNGDLRGMLTGAVTGAAMGGIAAHFGGAYSASRVIAEGTVGGLSAELQGGSFDRGFMISAGFSSLTWASLEMREAMIEQSRLNPRNASGISDGFRGDGFKLGGSRWPSQGSPLGGMQGGPGRFFNIDYSPGSLLDTLVEAYAGPHDFLNSPVFYTPQGLAANRWAGLELLNAANVILATPFAAAAATPSFAYGAFDD